MGKKRTGRNIDPTIASAQEAVHGSADVPLGTGVWIDGRKAVIIAMHVGGPSVRTVMNDLPARAPRSIIEGAGMSASRTVKAPIEVGKTIDHVHDAYLEAVVEAVGTSPRVIVFGPSGAMIGLCRRITERHPNMLCNRLTTAPMSQHQKVAWVKRYFQS